LSELADRAQEIREEASSSRRAHRWDFDITPGAPVDGRRQEIWTTADPGGSIEFVVAPAYVVDENSLIVKQLVFTSRSDRLAAPTSPDETSTGLPRL
jgi:hypothetical protein